VEEKVHSAMGELWRMLIPYAHCNYASSTVSTQSAPFEDRVTI